VEDSLPGKIKNIVCFMINDNPDGSHANGDQPVGGDAPSTPSRLKLNVLGINQARDSDQDLSDS